MLIAHYLGFTNKKRKYFEEKKTATLKSKQTLIATIRNHLRTLASFPNPLIFHWSLPSKGRFFASYLLCQRASAQPVNLLEIFEKGAFFVLKGCHSQMIDVHSPKMVSFYT
jgi:hypothetical protein